MGVFTTHFLPSFLPSSPCHKHARVYMQRPFAARPTTGQPPSLSRVFPPPLILRFGIRSAEKAKEQRNDFFFQRSYPSSMFTDVVGRVGRVGALTTLAGLHELPDETDRQTDRQTGMSEVHREVSCSPARPLGRAKHPPIFSRSSPRALFVAN